jgi:hypothetical protein
MKYLNRGSVEKTRIADSLPRVLVIRFDDFRRVYVSVQAPRFQRAKANFEFVSVVFLGF